MSAETATAPPPPPPPPEQQIVVSSKSFHDGSSLSTTLTAPMTWGDLAEEFAKNPSLQETILMTKTRSKISIKGPDPVADVEVVYEEPYKPLDLLSPKDRANLDEALEALFGITPTTKYKDLPTCFNNSGIYSWYLDICETWLRPGSDKHSRSRFIYSLARFLNDIGYTDLPDRDYKIILFALRKVMGIPKDRCKTIGQYRDTVSKYSWVINSRFGPNVTNTTDYEKIIKTLSLREGLHLQTLMYNLSRALGNDFEVTHLIFNTEIPTSTLLEAIQHRLDERFKKCLSDRHDTSGAKFQSCQPIEGEHKLSAEKFLSIVPSLMEKVKANNSGQNSEGEAIHA